MNVERHIRKLNRTLIAELGENPPYQWIYSESPEFMRPMRAMDEDGNLKWNYRCPCGLNKTVHSAECVAGALMVVEPAWEARKVDITMHNQWVLCCLQVPMPEAEWLQTFGSRLPCPVNGSWAPVCTETRTVAMAPEALPGENFNMAVIRGRQRSRQITEKEIANATMERDKKKDEKRKTKIRERLFDCLPVNPNPGSKHMATTSFGGGFGPSPELRRRIEKGESLVTILRMQAQLRTPQ